MSDYAAWRISTNTSNTQMIDTLRTRFKRYNKSTHSMVNNPERYGVCLLPEAETMLAAQFGFGRGLDAIPRELQASPLARPKQRTKPRQMSVYVTNEMYEDIRELMEAQGYATMQDFLMNLIHSVLGG